METLISVAVAVAVAALFRLEVALCSIAWNRWNFIFDVIRQIKARHNAANSQPNWTA
jgi:hypothetical protein